MFRRAFYFCTMACVTIAAPLAVAAGEAASRPNIVIILADDMGYGDVHALNPRSTIPTPNLDRLAREGQTFTDAHSPSAVCTPTRYGLLTGRYCWRSSLKRGVLNGYSPPLIEADRPTIASFLKQSGYTTGMVGKWHLGLGWVKAADGKTLDLTQPVTHGPNTLGFDHTYIIPASLDFPPYVYLRNGRVTQWQTVPQPAASFPGFLRAGPRARDLDMPEVLDHLLQQAVGFIREQAADGKPFFLDFALTAPHKPVLPHRRFRGKTQLGPYGDFVVQVDWTVGQVLQALDAAGIADKTLVIYTSDNGSYMYCRDDPTAKDHVSDPTIQAYRADRHRSNAQFRGTKADIWEAGHRIPFLARWPGRIEPGSHCTATVCLTDLFATCATIVGRELPTGAAPDSFSLLPAFEGKPWRRAQPVIHHSANGMFAIRDGKWKLVLGNGSGGRERPSGKPFRQPYQMFDLAKDIAERDDVLQENSVVAKRLERDTETIRRHEGSR